MEKFVHIGMPKTLTSALQQGFFAIHGDIYYLGIGYKGNSIDFIDENVSFIFETLLLYARETYYRRYKREAFNVINSHLRNAVKENKKVFLVSTEWLSFNFTPDMVDNHSKVKRLYELFGRDTKIIFFIRNQMDLIKSLYNEYVKVGLPYNYSEFVEYIYNFKDRNFYYDLFYDEIYQMYSEYFEKVYVFPIESFRDKNKELIIENKRIKILNTLCNIIGIKYLEGFRLPVVNPSLSDRELYQKLNLNKKYRHDFGNLIFEHANIHRNRAYFKRERATIVDVFKDVKIKRKNLEIAKERAKNSKIAIDYKADIRILEKMIKEFVKSNEKLEQISNLKLPDSYFNMRF